jgi:hypothetical protein
VSADVGRQQREAQDAADAGMRDFLRPGLGSEDVYCSRGKVENRSKEQQLDPFADRTSAATMPCRARARSAGRVDLSGGATSDRKLGGPARCRSQAAPLLPNPGRLGSSLAMTTKARHRLEQPTIRKLEGAQRETTGSAPAKHQRRHYRQRADASCYRAFRERGLQPRRLIGTICGFIVLRTARGTRRREHELVDR